ncbi:transposase [Rhizobium yanglingense]|nr:transposase [Rhizobium yanglingense]
MIHWDMLKKPAPTQTALEMVTLDSLVPKDHLLRKIDAVIDFSFIHAGLRGFIAPTTAARRLIRP